MVLRAVASIEERLARRERAFTNLKAEVLETVRSIRRVVANGR